VLNSRVRAALYICALPLS